MKRTNIYGRENVKDELHYEETSDLNYKKTHKKDNQRKLAKKKKISVN